MIRFGLGDLQVSILEAGRLWLDGGAMFGVVPRTLWQKERAPDERNRIELAMNVLLVEDGRQRILVDTGAGTKWNDKSRDIFRLSTAEPAAILEPAGLRPEDVDVVVCSHLHFDHAGGNTVPHGDGSIRPAFPEALYVMQSGEVATARRANERIAASYIQNDFEPLLAEPGRVRLVHGDSPLSRHLSLRLAPGHTPFMQVAVVRTRQRSLAFLADLVPTATHVRLPYVMGYDLEPLRTVATKKKLFPEAYREQWWLVFEHDARLPLGRLDETDGRWVARPVDVG